MRAVLESDPKSGSGYAILAIYDVDPENMPYPVLRRVSDGLVLAEGGWRKAPGILVPVRQENGESSVRFFLSPEIVDNLSIDQHYIVEIPGLGSCALAMAQLDQSIIVDANGQDMSPPPPQHPAPAPISDASVVENTPPSLQGAIFEGVASTPEIEEKIVSAPEPPAPAANDQKPPKKGKGCLLLSIAAVILWAGVAWLLWHGSMALPGKISSQTLETGEKGPIFEIIPPSKESSFIEDAPEKENDGK